MSALHIELRNKGKSLQHHRTPGYKLRQTQQAKIGTVITRWQDKQMYGPFYMELIANTILIMKFELLLTGFRFCQMVEWREIDFTTSYTFLLSWNTKHRQHQSKRWSHLLILHVGFNSYEHFIQVEEFIGLYGKTTIYSRWIFLTDNSWCNCSII